MTRASLDEAIEVLEYSLSVSWGARTEVNRQVWWAPACERAALWRWRDVAEIRGLVRAIRILRAVRDQETCEHQWRIVKTWFEFPNDHRGDMRCAKCGLEERDVVVALPERVISGKVSV